MRFLFPLFAILFLGIGCLKADVSIYQPPCTTIDDCPFDWACIESRCISPETPEEDIPKPTNSFEDAGSSEGAVDGVSTDAGSSDGTVDGVSTDAGSSDGTVDGVSADAGSSEGTTIDAGSSDGTGDGSPADAGSSDGTGDGDLIDAGDPLTCEDLNCGANSTCDASSIACVCNDNYHLDSNEACVGDDYDSDGVLDVNDNCPQGDSGWSSNVNSDYDSDGCKDDSSEDPDDDNDGVMDEFDRCQRGAMGWVSDDASDGDFDGCKDDHNEEKDLDNDGITDAPHTYFSKDYKLLSAGPRAVCALHKADIIHCIEEEEGVLAEPFNPAEGYQVFAYDQIDLGENQFVALKENQLYCRDDATCPIDTEMTQASAGYGIACGIPLVGVGVECWAFDANNSFNDPIVYGAPDDDTYVQIAVGENLACGLKEDEGEVHCWGEVVSLGGGLSLALDPPGMSDGTTPKFLKVDVGDNFACGITTNNKLQCWPAETVPSNDQGLPAGDFQDVTTGASHVCMRELGSTEISCHGLSVVAGDYPIPNNGGNHFNYMALVSGNRFSCGLRWGNGKVDCWGTGMTELSWSELNDGEYIMPADNCPYVYNPDQANSDNVDGGDACEPCEEGLFFSRYIAFQDVLSASVPGSPGGALAIYNPTSSAIDITGWGIFGQGTGGDAPGTQLVEFNNANGAVINAEESFVVCTRSGDTQDELCDILLQDSIVFGSSVLYLMSTAETVIDKIGPSPNGTNMGNLDGIFLELPSFSNLSYLKRIDRVTQGQVDFDLEEWTQVSQGNDTYDLANLGFDISYDGCQ